jgi:hypothetical protein
LFEPVRYMWQQPAGLLTGNEKAVAVDFDEPKRVAAQLARQCVSVHKVVVGIGLRLLVLKLSCYGGKRKIELENIYDRSNKANTLKKLLS